ncbi:S1C family serine protease [Eubacterium oxidoreducens]|uniref:Serine protease Do n=1 Tax=Eubacterium oxidoreducens TaxID=1732 RepID=A0A1G6CFX8_EUBOX|nr:PDZ domain-containing protein [Eubacterium oxidoreducens]SDB31741.1 serine protease Do [Eubacterium oxidoreducens]
MSLNQDEYELISEEIKDKPVSKKKRTRQFVMVVVFGIVLGAVAAVVFFFVQTGLSNVLAIDDETVMTEQQTDSLIDNSLVLEEIQSMIQSEVESGLDEADVSNLSAQQKKLYQIGTKMDSAIVTVTGIVAGEDWFETESSQQGQSGGIILKKGDKKISILTRYSTIKNADSITVSFVDDATAKAKLKSYDTVTGLAVISVALSELSEETLDAISVAALASEDNLDRGSIVIAIGSPLGSIRSVEVGCVSDVTRKVSSVDHNYLVITTDISGSENAQGAFINTEGEIEGIIMQDFSLSGADDMITAVSVSELSSVLDALLEGEQFAYLGIKSSTVTETMATEHNLPDGVYVSEIVMDSPAMEAGMQSGDVITAIDDKSISTQEEFEKVLSGYQADDAIVIKVKRLSTTGSYQDITCKAILAGETFQE